MPAVIHVHMHQARVCIKHKLTLKKNYEADKLKNVNKILTALKKNTEMI